MNGEARSILPGGVAAPLPLLTYPQVRCGAVLAASCQAGASCFWIGRERCARLLAFKAAGKRSHRSQPFEPFTFQSRSV